MQSLNVVLFLALVPFTSALEKRILKANGTFANREYFSNISVSNGGPWGTWRWVDMCPERSYAIGYSVKIDSYGGVLSDDTALNGIRLYCSPVLPGNTMYIIESQSERFGNWSEVKWCPLRNTLRSFQLKVEPVQVAGDNTAATAIRFLCGNNVLLEQPEEEKSFGDYGSWSNPCLGSGICGIRTKIQTYLGIFMDDTALNDVRFFCCL